MALITACLAAAVISACGGADEDEDIALNREILDRLPQLPGARATETTSAPYYSEERGPLTKVIGHTTNVVYAAPPRTRAARVVNFYASRLKPRWRCEHEREPITDLDRPSPRRRERQSILHLHCTSGRALVSVNTDSMPSSFEVVIDSRGARNEDG